MSFGFYNYKYIERMQCHKIINLLFNTNNQLSKFRTKNRCVKVNNKCRGRQNPGGETNFKTTMLSSSLYNQSDAYRVVKENTKTTGEEEDA